ncbi:hypothetical protein [Paraburkholderia acidisoli]|uniref:Uncharacterized protein n=1 Tax=Paraburkholderia acidisoli TaxID=2571748 RepID=A0A7Z2JDM0_9BURK|nr:hypothetical protein [Paraburkholderia acidisoli]QGZ60741.1 hypothetical protein FAZ98_02745 [Paraburkholderia acidisoli]
MEPVFLQILKSCSGKRNSFFPTLWVAHNGLYARDGRSAMLPGFVSGMTGIGVASAARRFIEWRTAYRQNRARLAILALSP